MPAQVPSALVVLAAVLTLPVAHAQSVEVIVHDPRAPLPIDKATLRAVFTMRQRQWPDGTPVRVFVLPDGDEVHDRFVREQLGTFPYVLRGTWDRLVFTGTGFAPTVVHSEEEMRQRVRGTPGAIGYVRNGTHSFDFETWPGYVQVSWSESP